jgi:hypothetical protein
MSKAAKVVDLVNVNTTKDVMGSLVERLITSNPTANIDVVKELLTMRREENAREAQQAFNEKMALAQADMRPIAADATNPQTRSKYASYAALDRALRPIYTKHGFAPSFNTEGGAPENHVRLVCYLTNCGHTREYRIDMPADGKGAKGGDVMTKTHATGSAVSYGMRYLLKMIFNVAVGEADDDGNKAGATEAVKQVTEAQVEDINDRIKKTKEPAKVAQILLQHFKVASFDQLSVPRYEKIKAYLKDKHGVE